MKSILLIIVFLSLVACGKDKRPVIINRTGCETIQEVEFFKNKKDFCRKDCNFRISDKSTLGRYEVYCECKK